MLYDPRVSKDFHGLPDALGFCCLHDSTVSNNIQELTNPFCVDLQLIFSLFHDVIMLADDEMESAGAGEARLREPPFPVSIMDCKTVDD